MPPVALRLSVATSVAVVALVSSAAVTLPLFFVTIITGAPFAWLAAIVAGSSALLAFLFVDVTVARWSGHQIHPASSVVGAIAGIVLGFAPSLMNFGPDPKRWFYDAPIAALAGALVGTYTRWAAGGERKLAVGFLTVFALVVFSAAQHVGELRGPAPRRYVVGPENPPVIEMVIPGRRLVGAAGNMMLLAAKGDLSAYFPPDAQQPNWSLNASPAAVLAQDGITYAVADRALVAIDRGGTQTWRVSAAPAEYEAALAVSGRVLVATLIDGGERMLAAIDPVTGVRQWTQRIGTAAAHQPTAALGPSGETYLSLDSEFRAVRNDGSLSWSVPGYTFNPAAVASDGSIYVTDSRRLFAIEPGGTIRWDTNDTTCSKKKVALSADAATIYCVEYTLRAFSRDGRMRWQWRPDRYSFLSGPATVLPDGSILVSGGGDNADLFLVGPSGALRWRSPMPQGQYFKTIERGIATASHVYLENRNHVITFRVDP